MVSFVHFPIPPYLEIQEENDRYRVKARLLAFGDLGRVEITLRHCVEGDECPLRMTEGDDPAQISFSREFLERSEKLLYYFEIYSGDGLSYFSKQGLTAVPPLRTFYFRQTIKPSASSWAADQVFYQIFPDRFYTSEVRAELKADAEAGKVRLMDWSYDPQKLPDAAHCLEYTGGTLKGIGEKLEHIQSLGCTGIYLNPFCRAPSNHRYDTEDYFSVDPYLGTNEDLAGLTQQMRERGLRLIGDAVINHIGCKSQWFKSACENENSAERGFFQFEPSGKARSWYGVESLPALNYSSEELRQRIFGRPDSVLQFWLNGPYGLDGWRFDVAQNVGRSGKDDFSRDLWPAINRACRSARGDAWLFGEDIYDASDIVGEGMLDSVMNYRGFYYPALKWLLRKAYTWPEGKGQAEFLPVSEYGAKDFIEDVQQTLAPYSHETQLLMFNFLGNHDMPRFMSLCDSNRSMCKLAHTLLLTFIGVPSIYYGDEIGLTGMIDPEIRKPMPWDQSKWDNDIYNHVKTLAALRRGHIALRRGAIHFLPQSNPDTLCFFRLHNEENLVVIFNRSDKTQRILRTAHPYLGRPLKALHSIGGVVREKSIELTACGSVIGILDRD